MSRPSAGTCFGSGGESILTPNLHLGEFRAHYAGFFDPGFGMNDGGSRAVLEEDGGGASQA